MTGRNETRRGIRFAAARSGWEQKAQLDRPFRIAVRRAASEEEFERLGGDTKHASEYFWRQGQTFLRIGWEQKRRCADIFASRGDTSARRRREAPYSQHFGDEARPSRGAVGKQSAAG